MLTLTSCVLRSDRAESVWMPTDLISTISGSFNPFADKEAPAPGDDDDELMLNVLRCHLTY